MFSDTHPSNLPLLLSVLFESCSGIIQESFINHSLIIHSGIIQESFINHHESSTDSILLLAGAPWCLDGVPDSSPFIAFHFLSFVYLCSPDRQRRSTHACPCVCMCVYVHVYVHGDLLMCFRTVNDDRHVHAHVCACTHALLLTTTPYS